MFFQKIAIASDHVDLSYKAAIIAHAKERALEVLDLGPEEGVKGSVDYPDFAIKLAEAIQEGTVDGAVAICGTGIGMSITTNKFSGIRSACPWNSFTVEMARRHNNINILCLGARVIPIEEAKAFFDLWLVTPFDGGRHQKRLDKIAVLDRKKV